MNHYRISRPEAYSPGTPGHTNPSARQGYYQSGETPDEAIQALHERWRKEKMDHSILKEDLTIQDWNGNANHGKVIIHYHYNK